MSMTWQEWEGELLKTHSLPTVDRMVGRERSKARLRELGWWILTACACAAVVWLMLALSGCGGGSMARVAPGGSPPPGVTPPPPQPPPSSVTLAAGYTLTLLQPVAGGTAAQAEAVDAAGDAVGWSVVDGHPEATEWLAGGRMIDLGPGTALAIASGGNLIAGYCTECGAFDPSSPTHALTSNAIAQLWPGGPIGTLPGYDSSEALGVDTDGTVVGVAWLAANPSVEQGWRYKGGGDEGGMLPVPGMAEALAIAGGQVAGFGQDGQAMAGGRGLGIQGAATAISGKGAAGFTFGTVTEAFGWDGSVLSLLGLGNSTLSLAAGINAGGVIVGQQGSAVAGSVRLARVPTSVARARFVGTTTAMGWTAKEGMVDLNGRVAGAGQKDGGGWELVFATGVNDAGEVVGAAVSGSTGQTVGFVLEAQP